jgi:hypothetical protein
VRISRVARGFGSEKESPRFSAGENVNQPLVVQNAAAVVLPRTYILCTEPAIENNRQFAARAQAEGWHYRELPTGHMAMLTLPDALTDLLLEVA